MKRNWIVTLLACIMIAGLVGGCGSGEADKRETNQSVATVDASAPVDEKFSDVRSIYY